MNEFRETTEIIVKVFRIDGDSVELFRIFLTENIRKNVIILKKHLK